MEKQNKPSIGREMDKQGLKVYMACAAVVYGLALYYCYSTQHFLEMGIVGAVMAVLIFFVINISRSKHT